MLKWGLNKRWHSAITRFDCHTSSTFFIPAEHTPQNSVPLFPSSLSICHILIHLSPVSCSLFTHPSIALCLSVTPLLITVQPEDCCLLISPLFPLFLPALCACIHYWAPRLPQTPSSVMYINKEAAYWCSLVVGNEAVDKQLCLPRAAFKLL